QVKVDQAQSVHLDVGAGLAVNLAEVVDRSNNRHRMWRILAQVRGCCRYYSIRDLAFDYQPSGDALRGSDSVRGASGVGAAVLLGRRADHAGPPAAMAVDRTIDCSLHFAAGAGHLGETPGLLADCAAAGDGHVRPSLHDRADESLFDRR